MPFSVAILEDFVKSEPIPWNCRLFHFCLQGISSCSVITQDIAEMLQILLYLINILLHLAYNDNFSTFIFICRNTSISTSIPSTHSLSTSLPISLCLPFYVYLFVSYYYLLSFGVLLSLPVVLHLKLFRLDC